MKKLSMFFTSIAALITTVGFTAHWPQNVMTNVSVAEIRDNPVDPTTNQASSLLLSQVLYAESMVASEEINGWYKVNLKEQQAYHNSSLTPCQGWIRASDTWITDEFPTSNLVVTATSAYLVATPDKVNDIEGSVMTVSMGTMLVGEEETLGVWTVRLNNGSTAYLLGKNATTLASLRNMSSSELRELIVDRAHKLIDTAYLPGGRSYPHKNDHTKTGVDASGLINLVYRTAGLEVPRFANDLLKGATTFDADPLAGDLLFFVDDATGNAVHVFLVVNDNTLYEATGQSQSVRSISAKDRLGKSLPHLRSGDHVDGYRVVFGSYMSRL